MPAGRVERIDGEWLRFEFAQQRREPPVTEAGAGYEAWCSGNAEPGFGGCQRNVGIEEMQSSGYLDDGLAAVLLAKGPETRLAEIRVDDAVVGSQVGGSNRPPMFPQIGLGRADHDPR